MSIKLSSFFCIALFFTSISCKNCDDTIVLPDLVYEKVEIVSTNRGFNIVTTIKNDVPIDKCDRNTAVPITQCISIFYKSAADSIMQISNIKNTISSLAAGQSSVETVQVVSRIIGTGTYHFELEIDCEHLIAESNEANNKSPK